MTAAATLTPAQLATELGTDARTTRKFLRSITPKDAQPGKGSRWAIKGTKTEIAAMRKKFIAFEKAQADAKAKRDAAKAALELATPDTAPDADEAIETEGIDALDPTDADIEAMAALEMTDEALDLDN
jgi:hypothetical protein